MDKYGAICWCLGKLTILVLTILFIAAIIYWAYSEKKGILYELREWSPEPKHQLVLTYLYLVSSYFLTILSVSYVFQSPRLLDVMATNPKIVVIISLILMTVLTALLELLPYSQKESLLKNLCWTLHCTIMGPAFAFFGPQICISSALKTGFALFLATLVSYAAPPDFYIEIKPHIHTLYFTTTFCSFLCFIFSPPVNAISLFLLSCNLCGGIILYVGVFITNTQYMFSQISDSHYDPVYTAAVMYLGTLNLYLRIAMFNVVELTNITCKT